MPIDLDALSARTLGNAALQRDLLQLFQKHTPPLLASLRSAWLAGDCATARATAHRLKGSAATIAAGPLAASLLELENAAAAGDTSAGETMLATVEAEAKRCLDKIKLLA